MRRRRAATAPSLRTYPARPRIAADRAERCHRTRTRRLRDPLTRARAYRHLLAHTVLWEAAGGRERLGLACGREADGSSTVRRIRRQDCGLEVPPRGVDGTGQADPRQLDERHLRIGICRALRFGAQRLPRCRRRRDRRLRQRAEPECPADRSVAQEGDSVEMADESAANLPRSLDDIDSAWISAVLR